MEHHVQSIDDALIGGLSYKLKPGASYVTERRSVTYFASGGNQYSPSGVKVCRFNIVADQWLDPSSFRVMFTLNNLAGSAAGDVLPLHWNPAILFRRARVIAGGTVLEDIDDFNRLSLMFTALKSQDDQKEIAMEGFGLFDRVHDQYAGGQYADPTLAEEDMDERKVYRVSDWDEAGSVKNSRTVLFKPMLGILAQEKLIPLRYCPLQIELELVSNAADCMYVGSYKGTNHVSNWGISDIQCKMDLLTLDSSLQNEYASHLLSGKSLPINFSSFNHTNQSTNGDKDFSAHINRALTRLKSVFITLYKDGALGEMIPWGHRKTANDFYHPSSNNTLQDLESGQHQVWVQVGSKLIPEYPMRDTTETFYQLRKAVGHPINIFSRWYHSTKYIIGIDLEKISGAGFTGLNTKAGELLTLNFRNCISGTDQTSVPGRVYCVLHYDAVLNIRDSGVELLD